MVVRTCRAVLVVACCAALVAVTFSGCSSSGNKMDRSKVEQIEKGVTTRAELESQLGPPTNASLQPDGRRMLTYMYHQNQMRGQSFIPVVGGFLGGSDMRQQTLQVYLTKDGIVEDYEFSDTSSEYRNVGGQRNIRATPTGQ